MAENIKKITIGNDTRTIEAAALGSEDRGSTTTPIYLEKGVAKAGKQYAGGTCVDLNGQDFAERNISIYAPTEAGIANGIVAWSNGAPTWVELSNIKAGKATADGSGNEITSTYATKEEVGNVSSDLADFENEIASYNYGGQIMTLQERAVDIESNISTIEDEYDELKADVVNLSSTLGTTSATVTMINSNYAKKDSVDSLAADLLSLSSDVSTIKKDYLSTSTANNTYITKASGINVKKQMYSADLSTVNISEVRHARITVTSGNDFNTQSGGVEVDFNYGEQVVMLSTETTKPGAVFELFYEDPLCLLVCRDYTGRCEQVLGSSSGDCSLSLGYDSDTDIYAIVELEWF